jgi:hypothetical protein
VIEQDVVVTLRIKDKDNLPSSAQYAVMGIYNKYFNKWFLVNQHIENEKPVWKPGMNKSKHCLVVGMVIQIC